MQILKFKKIRIKKREIEICISTFRFKKNLTGDWGQLPPTSKKVHKVGLSRRDFFEEFASKVHACNYQNTQKYQNRKHKLNDQKKIH